jgi:hypothetical protein
VLDTNTSPDRRHARASVNCHAADIIADHFALAGMHGPSKVARTPSSGTQLPGRSISRWHPCKYIDQALGGCRMSENRIAQHGVGQSAQHCCLNGRHHFARFRAKRGEPQDAVA